MYLDVTRKHIQAARDFGTYDKDATLSNPVFQALVSYLPDGPPLIRVNRTSVLLHTKEGVETLWELPSGVVDILRQFFRGEAIPPFSLLIPDRVWEVIVPTPIMPGLTTIGAGCR